MVWFCIIDLKLHPIAQFMENHIIHETLHSFNKINHLFSWHFTWKNATCTSHFKMIYLWKSIQNLPKCSIFINNKTSRRFLDVQTLALVAILRNCIWCNINNPFLCLNQWELLSLYMYVNNKWWIFWSQNVASFVEFEINFPHGKFCSENACCFFDGKDLIHKSHQLRKRARKYPFHVDD